MQVSMSKCKKRIATLWFIASGVLFIIFLLQTILGHYGKDTNEAWSWLFPNILPTLSLMTSVFIIDVRSKGLKIEKVDRFVFNLTMTLSAVYLLVLLILILSQPFSSLQPLEHLKKNSFPLGFFQGLVTATLGVFFVKTERPNDT